MTVLRLTRLRTAAALALVVAGATFAPAAGNRAEARPAPQPAVLEDCRERFVVVPGEERLVRERVPEEFELATDASGRPLLYVSAIRCARYTVDGRTRPTTAAAFAAMIRSPDGTGCMSGWPGVGQVKGDALSCNLYVLFVAYDNRAVVDWFRRGTPDLPVHFVRNLQFREGPLDPERLGTIMQFRAGRPAPSPYRLDLVVRERPVRAPLTATFWAATSSGIVRIRFHSDDLAMGEAEGTVRTAPGSEMAKMFGTDTPTASPGLSMIAGNRWAHGEIRKEVLP